MQLVDLTYHTHCNLYQPEQALELQKASIGFVQFIKEKLSIQLVKHLNYEGEKHIDGAQYVFFKSQNKFWHIPFKTHRYIQKQNPDIVLIQGLIFPLQLIALRFNLGKKTKLIVQHHGEKPFRGLKKVFQKIADRWVDVYLFTSANNAIEWIENGIISDKKKCFELLEGSSAFTVKDKLECKSRLSFKGSENFLWVGRLSIGKDPMTVINAFEKYITVCPAARLYMIYQSEEMLPLIKLKLDNNEQLREAVLLKGKVNHYELETWFNAADFYISASHKEGSGYALIEAMSCGCIPIVTNIPSFRKITGEGSFGFLFEPGNSESLLNHLFNLKNFEKETFSKSIRTHFDNTLSFQSIAHDLVSICESLVNE